MDLSKLSLGLVSFLLVIASALPAEAGSLARKGEYRTGPAQRVALTNMTNTGPRRVVGAVRQGDDRLKMIVWDVNDAGEITRRGDFEGHEVREVDVVALTTSRVAMAARTAGGNLLVRVFDVSQSGQLTARGTGHGGAVSEIALTTLGESRFATSVRTGDGRLKMIRWGVSGNGSVSREAETTDQAIGLLAATHLGQVTTAVADADDNLRLKVWVEGGEGFFNVAARGGGPIGLVAVTGSGNQTGSWFTATTGHGPTAVRTGRRGTGRRLIGAGVLKVIEWENETPNAMQGTLVRVSEASLSGSDGIAFDTAVAQGSPGALWVTATLGVGTYRRNLAKNQGKPRLQIRVWKTKNSDLVQQAEATLGGDYDAIDIAPILNTKDQLLRYVTAVIGTGGTLKLNVWDYTP